MRVVTAFAVISFAGLIASCGPETSMPPRASAAQTRESDAPKSQQRPAKQQYDAACRALPNHWGLAGDYLEPSLVAKAGATPDMWKTGVPNEPSRLYASFAKLDSKIPESGTVGCEDYRTKQVETRKGTTSFADEWAFQQKLETDRQAALTALRNANDQQVAQEAAEREKQKAEVTAIAKKKGYGGVVFDVGITVVVMGLVNGELTLDQAKGKVIELVPGDTFNAMQVVSKNQVIYTSDEGQQVVMLKNYGDTVLEGSNIFAIAPSYVVIKGTTTYRTLAGTRQAIVIQTAW